MRAWFIQNSPVVISMQYQIKRQSITDIVTKEFYVNRLQSLRNHRGSFQGFLFLCCNLRDCFPFGNCGNFCWEWQRRKVCVMFLPRMGVELQYVPFVEVKQAVLKLKTACLRMRNRPFCDTGILVAASLPHGIPTWHGVCSHLTSILAAFGCSVSSVSPLRLSGLLC